MEQITLTYDQLAEGGELNARNKTQDKQLASLVASIRQFGILQPLSVLKNGKGYKIIDGNRRFAALTELSAEDRPMGIPVLVQDADKLTAKAMSLAANYTQLPMRTIDRWEAFAALEKAGATAEIIANTFGLEVRQVERTLLLGKMHPDLRDELRNQDEINLNQVAMFVQCSPERQKELWEQFNGSLHSINQELRSERDADKIISANHPIRKFLTEEEYVKGGGEIGNDLFKPLDEQDWINGQLALRLANEKAFVVGKQLMKDEGWSFTARWDYLNNQRAYVKIDPEGPVNLELMPQHIHDEYLSLRDEAQKIENTIASLDGETQEAEIDEWNEAHERVSDRMDWYTETYRDYTDEQKKELGVLITTSFDIRRGYMLREKQEALAKGADYEEHFDEETGEPIPAPKEKVEDERADFPNAVNDELDLVSKRACQDVLNHSGYFSLAFLVNHLLETVTTAAGHYTLTIGGITDKWDEPTDMVKGAIQRWRKKKNLDTRMDEVACWDPDLMFAVVAYCVSVTLSPAGKGSVIAKLIKEKCDWEKVILDSLGFDRTVILQRLNKKQLAQVAKDENIVLDLSKKKGEICEELNNALPADWLPERLRA